LRFDDRELISLDHARGHEGVGAVERVDQVLSALLADGLDEAVEVARAREFVESIRGEITRRGRSP